MDIHHQEIKMVCGKNKSRSKWAIIVGSAMDEIVKVWFLNPLTTKNEFKQGSDNEIYVLQSLKIIGSLDRGISMKRNAKLWTGV